MDYQQIKLRYKWQIIGISLAIIVAFTIATVALSRSNGKNCHLSNIFYLD